MQATVEEVHTEAAHLSLDELAARRFRQLEKLYREGKTPGSLGVLDGALQGRMLALRRIDNLQPLAGVLRSFAASQAFVWEGKTFSSKGDLQGTGINRVRLPGVLGRQDLFPFDTRFGDSALDGKRAIIIDYDRVENPPYMRRIQDEIREVSPGVYLGPSMWKGHRGPVTLLWFALDARRR